MGANVLPSAMVNNVFGWPGAAYAPSSSYQQPTTSASSSTADGQTATTSTGNVDVLQKQVNEVVDIMRVNVTKVLERDDKLSELDSRAEGLADGSRQFQQTAARVKRKYWWQNCKMWLILIGVLIVIIIIIIVAVVTSIDLKGGSSSSGSATTTTASPHG